jgi:hypothetical protein
MSEGIQIKIDNQPHPPFAYSGGIVRLNNSHMGSMRFPAFERTLHDHIAKAMGIRCENLLYPHQRRYWVDPIKAGVAIDLMQERIPSLYPATVFNFHEEPMSIIPPLEVPVAPVAPAPEPLPPESASVQMLRKILAERRAEKDSVHQARGADVQFLENLEAKAAKVRSQIEQRDRHIAAARASIEQILMDIEKLGGRPEPTPEASVLDSAFIAAA